MCATTKNYPKNTEMSTQKSEYSTKNTLRVPKLLIYSYSKLQTGKKQAYKAPRINLQK